jgi:uncharacterized protein (TIGR02268 family)
VPQQRDVLLPSMPDAPVPEVYVAPGALTTLVMDGPLERTSLVVDEQVPHFALVDVGDRTLTLKPRGEWGQEKRLGLKARLKDGTLVALVLTTHPAQVDHWVNVVRPRSVESLQAELAALQVRCEEGGPMGLLRARMLDGKGVLARSIDAQAPSKSRAGLRMIEGMSYRATKWTLVDVRVQNLPGQAPWTPLKARLVGPGGLSAKVVAVWTEKGRLAAGEDAHVFVQTEAPRWDAGTVLQLEIEDSGGGRLLSITRVML